MFLHVKLKDRVALDTLYEEYENIKKTKANGES